MVIHDLIPEPAKIVALLDIILFKDRNLYLKMLPRLVVKGIPALWLYHELLLIPRH